MFILSKRDRNTQNWIEEQLKERGDLYTYYKNIRGEKILKWIYKDIENSSKIAIKMFKEYLKNFYNDIEITYAKDIGKNAVARYIGGTSTNVPIILIGIDKIINQLKKDAQKHAFEKTPEGIQDFIKTEIYPSVIISVLHELGHAIVDELEQFGYEYDEITKNEEQAVEEFARNIYDNDEIDDIWGKIISDIKKCRTGEELEIKSYD